MPRYCNADLVAEINKLSDLPLGELNQLWRELYQTEPPKRISRNLIVPALAYKLQENAFGGLKPSMKRRLSHSAVKRDSVNASAIEVARVKSGTRLVRTWKGVTHEVTVLDDGFSWQGRRYRSLSQIARCITGTRWSGPVFFGFKPITRSSHVPPANRSRNVGTV